MKIHWANESVNISGEDNYAEEKSVQTVRGDGIPFTLPLSKLQIHWGSGLLSLDNLGIWYNMTCPILELSFLMEVMVFDRQKTIHNLSYPVLWLPWSVDPKSSRFSKNHVQHLFSDSRFALSDVYQIFEHFEVILLSVCNCLSLWCIYSRNFFLLSTQLGCWEIQKETATFSGHCVCLANGHRGMLRLLRTQYIIQNNQE